MAETDAGEAPQDSYRLLYPRHRLRTLSDLLRTVMNDAIVFKSKQQSAWRGYFGFHQCCVGCVGGNPVLQWSWHAIA